LKEIKELNAPAFFAAAVVVITLTHISKRSLRATKTIKYAILKIISIYLLPLDRCF